MGRTFNMKTKLLFSLKVIIDSLILSKQCNCFEEFQFLEAIIITQDISQHAKKLKGSEAFPTLFQ